MKQILAGRMKITTFVGVLSVVVGTSLIGPAVSADDSLLFGQKQAYSAVVRTDKKVVTYAKIYLNNPHEKELKTTSFTLPGGIDASNLSVYQITLPGRCQKGLLPNEDTKKREDSFIDNPSTYTPDCNTLEEGAFNFDEYGYGYYGYSSDENSQLTYRLVDSKKSGNTYNITLPIPITSQKRGAYIVSYIANSGFVSGNFGLYNLEFKTLKVPQSIERVRVSVDVASDLYTREKRSDINSGPSSLELSAGMSRNSADASIKNKSLDKLQGSIGSGGVFTKTGKGLTPNEEFVVNGEFADAPWKLNLGWIVGGIIGLIVVIGLLVVLLKKAQHQEERMYAKEQANGK